MKVLWVTNTIFPQLSQALGKDAPVVGGWMYGLAKDLVEEGLVLSVVTVRPNIQFAQHSIDGTEYLLLKGAKPITEYDETLEIQWKKIIEDISPDIVHIHGTEYAHGLSLMRACPNLKYVISIQGMTSIISRYYYAGISLTEIIKSTTIRDILKGDGIIGNKVKFKKRGHKIEQNYLKSAKHLIGRTQWDHDHVKTINSSVNYHFCNESLRNSFYSSKKWTSDSKKDHTIFLSQASYPIKGVHKVLEAVHLIKSFFPNIKIRIAGTNILSNSNGLKGKLTRKGYHRYIGKLVEKLDLRQHIEFLGFLDEEQMINEYLNCHVFICPSSVENSPNSLGEAQILGVPCIASYVGGVPDSVIHAETGLLYRFEEVEMLAQSIKSIFDDENLAKKLSKNGILAASERHNRKNNVNTMISIYNCIVKGKIN